MTGRYLSQSDAELIIFLLPRLNGDFNGVTRREKKIVHIPSEILPKIHGIMDECITLIRRSIETQIEADASAPLRLGIRELGLSKRAVTCLEHAGIETSGDLSSRTKQDLLALRGFGKTCLNEVRRALAKKGLSISGQ